MRSDQPTPVRVLVADSSVIHTELLSQAIAKDRRIRVVELSTSSKEVMRGVVEARPDVLLISETLDQCPGGGLEVVRQLRATHPDLKSVVLLDSSEPEVVVRAFRSGARGIFGRDNPVKTLCKCISVVNEGQVWASSTELLFLVDALSFSQPLSPANLDTLRVLSDRERDVVACIAQGLNNRDIAAQLGISQHTVKNYMFRIFEKLNVSSRLELLYLVMSPGNRSQSPNVSDSRQRKQSTANQGNGLNQEAKVTAISAGSKPRPPEFDRPRPSIGFAKSLASD